jgi:glucose/arabinose dehydrogenase
MRRRRRVAVAAVAVALVPLTLTASHPAAAADGPGVEYEVLPAVTQDPMGIAVAPDGRVIWTEREGTLQVLKPDGTQITAGKLPVPAGAYGNAAPCATCSPPESTTLEEGGLYSVLLAKDFGKTGRLYLYRPIPGSRNPLTTMGYWRLSTFVLNPSTNQLDLGSEKKILEVPAEWDHCCHYGGDLDYLPDGTILLSVGDDVPATSSGGYGPRDTSQRWLDAELDVQNPADRRGKILRLMPDGSVPDGKTSGVRANPFLGRSGYNPYIIHNPAYPKRSPFAYVPGRGGSKASHTIKYDPYIYSLGYKQPFRGAVDPHTGTAYFSDVGPDASADDPYKGSKGYDERDVVPYGGGVNHGWPRCVANNKAYGDYDWVHSKFLGFLSCKGMTPAAFYYPHDVSKEWPQVGSGGTTGLPTLVYPDRKTGSLSLPSHYFHKLVDLEFSRGWLATFPLHKDGSLDTKHFQIETPFSSSVTGDTGKGTCVATLPFAGGICGGATLTSPINAAVGPDGAIYVVEYGGGYYHAVGSKIGRLKCSGCQPTSADYAGHPKVRTSTAIAAPSGSGGDPFGPFRLPAAVLLGAIAVAVLVRLPRREAVWA